MYTIKESTLAGHKTVSIVHQQTGNLVTVLADYGAAINGFVVNGKEILVSTPDDAGDFERVTVKAFNGAQLFPFVNRINGARYLVNGKQYLLPKNDQPPLPHSLHGLIYNKPFSITDKKEIDGEASLSYHFEKNEAYPFEFLITVTFKLSIHTLEVVSSIKNLSNEAAPAAHGWHPYIKVSHKVDDCLLQMPASKYYKVDVQLIPTGETAELTTFENESRIGEVDLNHCFEMPNGAVEYTTSLTDAEGTRIQLVQKGYHFTQYYIPPDRKSIAIEPQTCIADALHNSIGLIWIEPQQQIELSFKLTAETKTLL